MTKLIIRYEGNYIISYNSGLMDFIQIPIYFNKSALANISLFIMFLCEGILDNDYSAKKELDYTAGLDLCEKYFDPDFLKEIDEDVYLYDLDDAIRYSSLDLAGILKNNLKKLPNNLIKLGQVKEELFCIFEAPDDEKIKYRPRNMLEDDLKNIIRGLEVKRSNKDVLLLYSGGRDSTLSAIRLVNAGYNVYFIHFNNGMMLDVDKPYLTWKKTFVKKQGYHFFYSYSAIDISEDFNKLYSMWKERYGDKLENGTITSEIRCLSCRTAMYLKILEIAKKEGFKYIADGARRSQKFELEQLPMIDRFQSLAKNYGIEVLYPVLDLEDDDELKRELIDNGLSSKTWESKCLLGRRPMNKTEEAERVILDYYDNNIMLKLKKRL